MKERPTIHTRVDKKRGCGFRKEGGLYLMAGTFSRECGRLPIPLDKCPTCNGGIKQTRGWTWIDLHRLLKTPTASIGAALPAEQREALRCLVTAPTTRGATRDAAEPRIHLVDVGEPGERRLVRIEVTPVVVGATPEEGASDCRDLECPADCTLSAANPEMPERAGLLWIGREHYPTVEDFVREGAEQGISRRISTVPNGFKVGETWVMIAHPKTIGRQRSVETATPGIFGMFLPHAIEYVVRPGDDQEHLERLEERGITLVRVEKAGQTRALPMGGTE